MGGTMALAGPPFVGSGRFVPDRAWSCSQHDYPQYHECDCGHCPVGEWECSECAGAAWVDQFDGDGSIKMRELGLCEGFLLDTLMNEAEQAFAEPILAKLLADFPKGNGAEVVWMEDVSIPVVSVAEDAA